MTAVGSRPRLHIIPWSSYDTEIAADGTQGQVKPASAMMERPVLLPVIHFFPSLTFSLRLPVLPGFPTPRPPKFSTMFSVSPCCRPDDNQGFFKGKRDLYNSRGLGLGTRHNAALHNHSFSSLQLFSVVAQPERASLGAKAIGRNLKCPKAVVENTT